jgi:phosphoribosylformylglycinamidine synthase PurS subunit
MMFLARIHVMLKTSVLDPQGAAVGHALHALGYDEVEEVRMGKRIEVRLRAPDAATARERVKAMCENLLANLVIEKYEFELTEADA